MNQINKISSVFLFLMLFSTSIVFSQSSLCKLDSTSVVIKNTFKDSVSTECCLIVINPDMNKAEWFVLRNESIHKLEYPPEQFMRVDDVIISADNKYLAYVSVGEGHPVLEIVDFSNFKKLKFNKKHKVMFGVNPYPGYISVTKQFDNDKLVVESDMSLDKIDAGGDYKKQYDESRKFEINLITKKIKEVK